MITIRNIVLVILGIVLLVLFVMMITSEPGQTPQPQYDNSDLNR